MIPSLVIALFLGLFFFDTVPAEEGLVPRHRRFVGIPVDSGPHPTVVQVLYYGLRVCDGSIIAPNLILTAASCIIGFWNNKVTVMASAVGENLLYYVTNIDYHPHYVLTEGRNDIAILKLDIPIDTNGNFTLVKLPLTKKRISLGSEIVTYRWSEFGSQENLFLQDTRDRVIPITDCTYAFKETEEKIFCAESSVSEKVSHQMTGGPAIFDGYQVGIVISDRVYNYEYAIFTNVSHNLEWIYETSSRLSSLTQNSTAFYPLSKTDLKFYSHPPDTPKDETDLIFTVAIIKPGTNKLACVGTIISSDMVLTTARCAKKGYKSLKVRVVSKNYVSGFKEHEVAKVFLHPRFNESQFPHVHDVAILQIKPKFNLGVVADKIDKIGWRQSNDELSALFLYGFGQKYTSRLVQLALLDDDECDWVYEKIGGMPEGLVCARSRNGLCNHSTGEPLFIEDQLIGILTAVSNECSDVRHPAVFVNVTANLDWISKRVSYLDVKDDHF